VGELHVYRAFGVPRVLLANELTDLAGAAWLAGELAADPGFDCYVYADSLAGVQLLDEAVRQASPARPLPVLVELGYPGGRTGCRGLAAAEAVARAVARSGSLRLAGPEPGLALACAGRRDVAFDSGLPVPLRIRGRDGALRQAIGMEAVRLDDQHCYLQLTDGTELEPAETICFGVSHPCTTFDKW